MDAVHDLVYRSCVLYNVLSDQMALSLNSTVLAHHTSIILYLIVTLFCLCCMYQFQGLALPPGNSDRSYHRYLEARHLSTIERLSSISEAGCGPLRLSWCPFRVSSRGSTTNLCNECISNPKSLQK